MKIEGVIFEQDWVNAEILGDGNYSLEHNFSSIPHHFLGEVDLKKKHGLFVGDINMWGVQPENVDKYLDCYPSLGFVKTDLYNLTVTHVSLSTKPNVDPSIKTIREQLKQKE